MERRADKLYFLSPFCSLPTWQDCHEMWCKKRKRKAEGRSVDESTKQQKTEPKESDQEVSQLPTEEETNAPLPQADEDDGRVLPTDNNPRNEQYTKDSRNDYIDGKSSFHPTQDAPPQYDHERSSKATFEYNHSSTTGSGSANNRHGSEYIETAEYEQLSPASDSQTSRPYIQETEYRGYGYTKESRETHYESSRYDRHKEQYDYPHDKDRGSYTGSRRIASPRERSDAFLRW